jgi:hypothetical protein
LAKLRRSYLGDLQRHAPAMGNAAATSAALDPKLTMAQASLELSGCGSRVDEAKGALREAVNANSNNYLDALLLGGQP